MTRTTFRTVVAYAASVAVCSVCRLPSQVVWTDYFYDRRDHAMAVTGAGAVLLGGRSAAPTAPILDDAWRRDAAGVWRRLDPTSGPGPLTGHAAASHRLTSGQFGSVFFGGENANQRLAQTWTYDGNQWSLGPPASALLFPRTGHGMAGIAGTPGNAGENVIVLFGGFDGVAGLADTWEYSQVGGWIRRLPQGATPPGRFGHAMAWDGFFGSHSVIMFGGAPFRSDTWIYDSVTLQWSARVTPPGNTPPGRIDAAMAFDPIHDELVLFGGLGSGGLLSDTWVWDRNAGHWVQRSPANSPSARSGHRLVFVSGGGRSRILLVGGADAANNALPGLWEWDGTNWLQPASPTSRYQPGLAYDEFRQRLVLFSGLEVSTNTFLNDTWEFDGVTWTQRQPPTAPPTRWQSMMTFDAARRTVVMVGGDPNGGGCPNHADSWTWDGNSWSVGPSLPAAPGLGAANSQLAFDRTNGRVLLPWFDTNCLLAPGIYSTDGTGTTWSVVGGSGPVSSRVLFGAAFDDLRRELVVFGGYSSANTYHDETWIWDGANWRSHQGVTRPSRRAFVQMAYDRFRDRIVMYGGSDGVSTLSDTWEWDGTTWSMRSPGATPGPMSEYAMAFDSLRGSVVMAGPAGRLWELRAVNPARLTSFGSGCGRTGPMSLSHDGGPYPYLGNTVGLIVSGLAASSPFAVFLGASDQTWGGQLLPLDLGFLGMLGCQLSSSIDVTLPPSATRVPVPVDIALVGQRVFVQGFGLDPLANSAGVVTSNSLAMTIGAK